MVEAGRPGIPCNDTALRSGRGMFRLGRLGRLGSGGRPAGNGINPETKPCGSHFLTAKPKSDCRSIHIQKVGQGSWCLKNQQCYNVCAFLIHDLESIPRHDHIISSDREAFPKSDLIFVQNMHMHNDHVNLMLTSHSGSIILFYMQV